MKPKNKKYKLVKDRASGLYRVVALRSFGDVKKGSVGGLVESENNLSQEGSCWVYGNAQVYGEARVCGNAQVYGNAKVYGEANVSGEACVYGDAWVFGNAKVYDRAQVYDRALVYGEAMLGDNAKVYGNAYVRNNATVYGNASIYGKAGVYGEAEICGDAKVKTMSGYMVFKNSWSSGRWFTWTKSNCMWKVGCFYGTGKELIAKAKKDSALSGKCYAAAVKFVETVSKAKHAEKVSRIKA